MKAVLEYEHIDAQDFWSVLSQSNIEAVRTIKHLFYDTVKIRINSFNDLKSIVSALNQKCHNGVKVIKVRGFVKQRISEDQRYANTGSQQ